MLRFTNQDKDGRITETFAVDPAELKIDRSLLIRGLGYKNGIIPSPVSDTIDRILETLPPRCDIRCGVVAFPPEEVSISADSVLCGGSRFGTGPVISKPLKSCDRLALFVATVGPYVEQWSRQLMQAGDTLKGYIVDSAGSDIAERTADWLEEKLRQSAQDAGWKISNRYSPGYCGWPVSDQHALFSLLPKNFCGIRLTDSALMQPMKSVSGIIGLGPNAKRSDYQCKICDMEDCYRRREEDLA